MTSGGLLMIEDKVYIHFQLDYTHKIIEGVLYLYHKICLGFEGALNLKSLKYRSLLVEHN